MELPFFETPERLAVFPVFDADLEVEPERDRDALDVFPREDVPFEVRPADVDFVFVDVPAVVFFDVIDFDPEAELLDLVDDLFVVVEGLDLEDPDFDEAPADLAGDLALDVVDLDVRDFALADFAAVDLLPVGFAELDLEAEDFLVVGIVIPPSNFQIHFKRGPREDCNHRTATIGSICVMQKTKRVSDFMRFVPEMRKRFQFELSSKSRLENCITFFRSKGAEAEYAFDNDQNAVRKCRRDHPVGLRRRNRVGFSF